MKILHRKRLGLPADPWARLHLPTSDNARVGQLVRAAAEARLMVSLAGPRGGGKTASVRYTLRHVEGVRVVEPLRLTRERLHMGDIESAIVRDLAPDERPRRSGEARSHQVRRVLGQRSRDSRIVLVIDDAHVLHHSTLRALKRLRELSWLGVSPLLGIVLVGQSDRTAAIPEVGLRADRLWLAGLTPDEAAGALCAALNRSRRVIDDEAARRLAASPRARNWLDLQALADECMAEAVGRGEDRVTAGTAWSVLHPEQRPAPDIELPAAPEDDDVADLLAGIDDDEDRGALRRAG